MHRCGTSWFVLSGTRDGTMFYERVTFTCGGRRINSWAMLYPVAERRLYDRIVEQVARSYPHRRGQLRVGEGLGGARPPDASAKIRALPGPGREGAVPPFDEVVDQDVGYDPGTAFLDHLHHERAQIVPLRGTIPREHRPCGVSAGHAEVPEGSCVRRFSDRALRPRPAPPRRSLRMMVSGSLRRPGCPQGSSEEAACRAGTRSVAAMLSTTGTPVCLASSSGSTWISTCGPEHRPCSACSMRSQISCEAATVMLPGTTRWNSMKVTRPAARVLTSWASMAPSALLEMTLPDMARDLGRHGLVHQAAHGLGAPGAIPPTKYWRRRSPRAQGSRTCQPVTSASISPTMTPTEVATSVMRCQPSPTSAGERWARPQVRRKYDQPALRRWQRR